MKIYCDALKDMWRGPDVKGLIVWRVLLTLNLCRLLLCKYLFVSEDGNIITNNEEKEKKTFGRTLAAAIPFGGFSRRRLSRQDCCNLSMIVNDDIDG